MQTKGFLLNSSKTLSNLGLIALGSLIFIIGMNGILVPHGFLSGGVVGLAILLHYLFPVANIGVVYFLMNIPLLILGWFNISRRFMLYTLFGMLFFSLLAAIYFPALPYIKDPILAALAGGVVCGTGEGLILRSLGSAGGTDIIAVYLYNKFGFRIGLFTFSLCAAILLAGASLYDLELTLFSIIYLYVQGRVTDAIMVGFSKKKTLMVISDNIQPIAQKIMENGRTATFFKGVGAYSGNEKNVLYTVANFIELPQMKDFIFKQDPNALVVVYDTLEILGKRYGAGRIF
jgi:uncharacterized membrane-anchored protein YitT (DUF2179 family)